MAKHFKTLDVWWNLFLRSYTHKPTVDVFSFYCCYEAKMESTRVILWCSHHTYCFHSEDNRQCFLAVVLAVCFAMSIMILNVFFLNIFFCCFFQGLFNPEVRYSLRVILSVILGFFTGYSGSGWENKHQNCSRNFQKWRMAKPGGRRW